MNNDKSTLLKFKGLDKEKQKTCHATKKTSVLSYQGPMQGLIRPSGAEENYEESSHHDN